jgi:prephenate dehydrogenase
MVSSISSVGIIGQGSFGNFMKTLIPRTASILVYDPKLKKDKRSELKSVIGCDILILAIPLSAYDKVLKEVAKYIPKDTLIIDVCSVKEQPERKIAKQLANHNNILLTHPLFGPQSAAKSTKGFSLIVTKCEGDRAKKVVAYCKNELGLKICLMTSKKHDQLMSQVHALTFFIAKSLNKMGLPDSVFHTPSYLMIDNLIKIDKDHSPELFKTIELGNAYAKNIRSKFLSSAMEVNKSIDGLN